MCKALYYIQIRLPQSIERWIKRGDSYRTFHAEAGLQRLASIKKNKSKGKRADPMYLYEHIKFNKGACQNKILVCVLPLLWIFYYTV